MKIHGEELRLPNVEICVIPRGNGTPIVFKCQAVLDMTSFEQLCPTPTPPKVVRPGKRAMEDAESPMYKMQINEHAEKRMAYLLLKGLEATEGLEWETVKLSDPATWKNYTQELKDSGFSQIEIMRIINLVAVANCLDENRLEKARNDFLAGVLVQANGQSILKEEPVSIVSGEPVKDSESDPQES